MKNNSFNIDDLAAKLPQVEFKARKKANEYYNQKMQSLRGARQFILRTHPEDRKLYVKLTLFEYGEAPGELLVVASRSYASLDGPEAFTKALKSLERAAKCKLYYVLLISTDGEYL